MKKILFLLILSVSFQSNSQDNSTITTEKNIASCYNNWFKKSEVDLVEFQNQFESYFIVNKLIDSNLTTDKKYEAILKILENPPKKLPKFQNKNSLVELIKKLNISNSDIIKRGQLKCLMDFYKTNKSKLENKSGIYAIGITLEHVERAPGVSQELLISSIRMNLNKNELKKDIVQISLVILLFPELILLTD
jgi:hypothetical protein